MRDPNDNQNGPFDREAYEAYTRKEHAKQERFYGDVKAMSDMFAGNNQAWEAFENGDGPMPGAAEMDRDARLMVGDGRELADTTGGPYPSNYLAEAKDSQQFFGRLQELHEYDEAFYRAAYGEAAYQEHMGLYGNPDVSVFGKEE
jgi:hypothetical protein